MFSRVSPFRIWLLQAAARHAYGDIAVRTARGECIDSPFVIEQINLRDRCAGGNRHFFNHMSKLLFVEIARIGFHQAPTQQFGDNRPALREAPDFEVAAQENNEQRPGRNVKEQRRTPGPLQVVHWMHEDSRPEVEDRNNHVEQGESIRRRFAVSQNERGRNKIDESDHDSD